MQQLLEESPIPKYYQLAEILYNQVREGNILAGHKLMSEREISKEYKVSHFTVRQALDHLEKDGIINRVHGKGTFIKEPETGLRKTENTLGIIDYLHRLDFSHDLFWAGIFDGMKREAASHSYDLTFLTSISWERFNWKEAIQRKNIAGLIVTQMEKKSEMVSLMKTKTPFVLINDEPDGLKINCVVNDEVGGGYEATKYLIKLGHKKIGCILLDLPQSLKRYEGYKLALKDSGIELEKNWVKIMRIKNKIPNFEIGYLAMQELLMLPDRLESIFVTNDLIARGAIKAANEAGLNIPQDLAIVGFDDIVPHSPGDLPLTTVKVCMDEMGKSAVRLLINNIETKDTAPQRIIIPTKLIVRESCGANLRE